MESCYDMFNDSPEFLIGKICVFSSSGGTDKYLMIQSGESTFSYIFHEVVSSVLANDSLMYVQTVFLNNHNYYYLTHTKGQQIISVHNIDSSDFLKKTTSQKFIYSYTPNNSRISLP
jgi:hypothetical protein